MSLIKPEEVSDLGTKTLYNNRKIGNTANNISLNGFDTLAFYYIKDNIIGEFN